MAGVGLYEVSQPPQGPNEVQGVAISSRHQLDAKVRPGSQLDIAELLKCSDDAMATTWRGATSSKGGDAPKCLDEFRARRVENISWRIWMGNRTRSRPVDELAQISLPVVTVTPDPVSPSDSWDNLYTPQQFGNQPEEWAFALHGGAGTISDRASVPKRLIEFRQILQKGKERLQGGAKATDVATEVVVLLEDCPFFNAGRGSVLTAEETFEMDAGFMDGATGEGAGVATCSIVKNPVKLARVVSEKTSHCLVVGSAADALATAHGLETADRDYFLVQERLEQLRRNKARGVVTLDHGGEQNDLDAPAESQEETLLGMFAESTLARAPAPGPRPPGSPSADSPQPSWLTDGGLASDTASCRNRPLTPHRHSEHGLGEKGGPQCLSTC
eukprot:TRINITY_DN7420_c0_g1_i14.p1 TRINITY_DN7420_c0_g1~~TRINITY_DN7420_c0_g1_i14.p1  ORF type:complete len:387 (+),score=38.29 TRINITY_DN7420_c0_g1_i14:180-1340(+)